MLTISSTLAIGVGILMFLAGISGLAFTYSNVSREHIITPEDASIPNAKVRGPLTIISQVNAIHDHALKMTGGKTYADMPRFIPARNESGESVLDENGELVMEENTLRDVWITVTTLKTALNLALITYAFSALVVLFGLISMWTGIIFYILKNESQ